MDNSKKNLSPMIWGPCGWIFLHSISYSYPIEPTEIHKQQYYNFLDNLKYVLPCEMCRKHYTTYFSENKPKLNSRDEFVEWLIDLHNDVNKRNNKKIYTYEEIHKKYMELYKNKKKLNPLTDDELEEIKFCFALFLVVIFIFSIWKVVKNK